MKMSQAMHIIREGIDGYMVRFEWKEGNFLRVDYFPEKHCGESLIENEEKAWDLASKFAHQAKGKVVNLYVVDHEFKPVKNYQDRIIKNN